MNLGAAVVGGVVVGGTVTGVVAGGAVGGTVVVASLTLLFESAIPERCRTALPLSAWVAEGAAPAVTGAASEAPKRANGAITKADPAANARTNRCLFVLRELRAPPFSACTVRPVDLHPWGRHHARQRVRRAQMRRSLFREKPSSGAVFGANTLFRGDSGANPQVRASRTQARSSRRAALARVARATTSGSTPLAAATASPTKGTQAG